jgi:two-component system, LytTR family, sensor kinase
MPIYFAAWSVLALFLFTQSVWQARMAGEKTPAGDYLISWFTGAYIWVLLTPVVVQLTNRFPLERKNWLRRTGLHLVLSIAVALVQTTLESSILPFFHIFPPYMKTFVSTFLFLMVIGFHQAVLTYWIIMTIELSVRYHRAYQERKERALQLELNTAALESQLAQAQLHALKAQLQPHFLFNTLNAIMVLVRQREAAQAEETLGLLSDLLRCVLEDVGSQEVPLRREMEYLRLYLSIEEVRFRDRLRVEIATDPGILDAAVPHMGLQPLVENAIRHGIGRRSQAGVIRILGRRVDNLLEIRVEDDGPGLPATGIGQGIGLRNTRERLHQLYGERAQLIVENRPQGGARAIMSLPYHTAETGTAPEWTGKAHAIEHARR